MSIQSLFTVSKQDIFRVNLSTLNLGHQGGDVKIDDFLIFRSESSMIFNW
jgi:hypothetical protein